MLQLEGGVLDKHIRVIYIYIYIYIYMKYERRRLHEIIQPLPSSLYMQTLNPFNRMQDLKRGENLGVKCI
jgi:hypothetical protein